MTKDQALDIAHRLSTKVQVGSKYVALTCPFAPYRHRSGSDEHPSAEIYFGDGEVSIFVCFAGCDAGSIVWVLGQLCEYDPKFEPIRMLAAKYEESEYPSKIKTAASRFNHDQMADSLAVWDENELQSFKRQVPRWALERGISFDTYKLFEAMWDDEEKRLVFPVRRSDGALVGLEGRSLGTNGATKWKSYWNFKKSHYLYGLHRSRSKIGIVCEGVFDVLKLWEHTEYTPLGLLGSRISGEQIDSLMGFEKLFLFLDGDDAGRNGTARLKAKLSGRLTLFDVKVPDGEDPGSLDPDAIHYLLETSKFLA